MAHVPVVTIKPKSAKQYEVVQDTAHSAEGVRITTQKMTAYFEAKGYKVISHTVYWNQVFSNYVINMIGRG